MTIVDDLQKWVTIAGAVIAALVSSAYLWLKFREKTDKIKVGVDPLEPPIEPGYWLNVVSLSDHQMNLKDYGFIDETGRLFSLPQHWADEPINDERIVIRGNRSFTQRGDLFEVGNIELRNNPVGAFAITVGQSYYTLGFRYDISWCKQLWMRIKVRWKPRYQ